MLVNLLLFLLFSACYCNDEKPVVKTPLGAIQGYIKTSHGGRKFAAFEGIPFAKPPIGSRRFEEPEPIEPWNGVWDASYLTQCAQTNLMEPNNPPNGDENCLHINVYVPTENPNPKDKWDVIIHVHGGAYMYGSGHAYSHPDFIMDRDIIFVTFNYRLGILGFLSTEDDIVPGNNGLKDQVLALKWVQENIASFGGNPDSVTLTGLSAGGSSVHFHYFSEMSKGLFHRGFSQSGVALNSFSLQEEPLSKAQRLAGAVGCPSSPTQDLVDCLKERPYKQLLDKISLFFGYKFLPFAPFAPVVEKGSKPFLKADPYDLLTKGEVLDVPWVTSHTSHEGLFPFIFLKDDLDNINENWETLAPALLDFDYTLPRKLWKSTFEKIKTFYLGENQNINEENAEKFIQMLSDRIFLVDAETAIKLQAKLTTSPVYYYYFSYPGDHNEQKMVIHGGDAAYFFGHIFVPRPLTPDELKMKDIMIDMLISYATTGIPAISGVDWKPTKGDKLTFIEISGFEPGEIKLRTVDEFTPRSFWNSLKIQENENLISVKDEL